jgi:hypothetical protein
MVGPLKAIGKWDLSNETKDTENKDAAHRANATWTFNGIIRLLSILLQPCGNGRRSSYTQTFCMHGITRIPFPTIYSAKTYASKGYGKTVDNEQNSADETIDGKTLIVLSHMMIKSICVMKR